MAKMRDALADTAQSAYDEMMERRHFDPVLSSIESENDSGERILGAAMIIAMGPEAQRLVNLYRVVYGVAEETEPKRIGDRDSVVKLVKDPSNAP